MDSPDAPGINPTAEAWARLRNQHVPEWVRNGLRLPPERRKVYSSRFVPPRQPPRRREPDEKRPDYVPSGNVAVVDNVPSCCFYAYSDFADSTLLYADAPTTVTFASTYVPGTTLTLTKYLGVDTVNYSETGDASGLIQLDTGFPSGGWEVNGIYETVAYSGDNPCLFASPYLAPDPSIDPGAIFDNFDTTYTLTGPGISTPITLTRTTPTNVGLLQQGSCIWKGGGYRLDYGITTAVRYTLKNTALTPYTLAGNQTAPNANGSANYAPYTVA